MNHFSRGKSHTTPEKEEDICTLQRSYHTSQLHQYTPGRRLHSRDLVKDTVARGAEPERLKKAIANWLDSRLKNRSSLQDWSDHERLDE